MIAKIFPQNNLPFGKWAVFKVSKVPDQIHQQNFAYPMPVSEKIKTQEEEIKKGIKRCITIIENITVL